jgi:hypothetical protein
MMNYSLVALVLKNNPSLPLTEGEFNQLKLSRTRLAAAFSLEEIYNLLITNYREFEMEVLSAGVDEMTSCKDEYEDFFDVRSSLNRRALNLLSAARLYIDQFQQWLKEVGADPTNAKKKASEAYDSSFDYRFMEALRNHVQHVGLAVHGVTINSRWVPQPNPQRLEFAVIPYTQKSNLAQDPKFKKSVLNESPAKVPTLSAARAYVGGISSIHDEVRALAEPFVKEARAAFEAAIATHCTAASKKYPVLAAVAKEGAVITEEVPVFLKWDDVRLKLVAKNRTIVNLAKRSINNRSDDA